MAWIDTEVLSAKNPPSSREIQDVERFYARRAKPRFFADENFPDQAVKVLREIGGWVKTVKEVGLRGHPDENHTAYALKCGLILVTCDRDFLDNRRFPIIHCPAIFVFDFGGGTVAEIKQAFRCLGPAFYTPQFFDKWCKVDARRTTWTETARFLNGFSSRTRYRISRGRIEEWVED